jgi:hypothetical protein
MSLFVKKEKEKKSNELSMARPLGLPSQPSRVAIQARVDPNRIMIL